MKTRTRIGKILAFVLPFAGSIAALTWLLTTLAWARDALPADSIAPSLRPLARPHDPSSGVYTLYDTLTPSDAPTATYEWIEIRHDADDEWRLGNDFSNDGDVSLPYPIGFFFPFYADLYDHFRVSEKGFIFFEKSGANVGTGSGLVAEIPGSLITMTNDTNNFIAPFAGDLFGHPGISRVYVKRESIPERRTIIEFENVVWCCGMNNPRTFQIILYPSGDIQTQYLKITNFAGELMDMGQIVRVGLEDWDGARGDVYTQGLFLPNAVNYWQDEMAIRFQSAFSGAYAVFVPSAAAIWDDPGVSITTTAILYLGAAEDVTRSFTLSASLAVSSSVAIADWAGGVAYPASIPPITGTYSATLPLVVSIPSAVTDPGDVATLTLTAVSTDAAPLISATFTLNYGPAHRDLQLEKTLNPDIPPAADEGAFRYRLVIVNTDYYSSNRAAVVHGVIVTDLLPAGVVYEDCRRTYDWYGCGSSITTGTIGNRTVVTLDLGTMGIDEVETWWLELRNTGNALGAAVNNTAHVTTTQNVELGYGPNNHSSAAFTVAAPETELHIDKYFPYWYRNRHYVAAGQAIPFDIYFYNDGYDRMGNVPLYDATIVDLLAENTTFDHADLYYDGPELTPDAEGPLTPTISGPLSRTLTFAIPFVDNGWWNEALLRIWVYVPQATPIGTQLTNIVTISHGSDSASDSETVEVVSNYVDPFVDKEPSFDNQGNVIRPVPGRDYTYWIYYGNRSMAADATDVIVTDTLPYSVTLVSVSAAQYLSGPVSSVLPDGRVQLTWYPSLDPDSAAQVPIPPGWTGQIALVVHVDERVPRGTVLVNQVTITYTGMYIPATRVDDTDVVTLEVASDLEGSRKLVDDPTPDAGDEIQYTIVVSNVHLTRTISFTVSDALPAGLLAYTGHDTPTTGIVLADPDSLLWLGEVGPTDQVTLAFRASIADVAYAGQRIRNTMYITGGDIYLERWCDIVVARGVFDGSRKAVSAAAAIGSGDSITYTITARNDGSTSRVVTVTDSLPPSVTLVSGSFNPTTGTAVLPPGDNRAFTWTISVDGMSSESLNFQVTVTDGLTTGVTITNVAYLDDGFAPVPLPLVAAFTIGKLPGSIVYLPLVLRNY
jgi:uncharacterized repeat protein (TIGR01451 family)